MSVQGTVERAGQLQQLQQDARNDFVEHFELLLSTTPLPGLWWQISRSWNESGWHEVESAHQLEGLVLRLVGQQANLAVEDYNGTKYVQITEVGQDEFVLEIGYLGQHTHEYGWGTYNWRVGPTVASEDAPNQPDRFEPEHFLTSKQAIEVLQCWAAGTGIPLGYGASLHVY
ncbi:hypothetical protein [Zhihengliuella flava]|uniref:Uncharacterized protein n=1 Tax=Zhihengliuella flava TaxID=1285193 RepID=A0A931D9B7_9MICC|nr:hypothetical protein [Zhihengliuella flava]MBG6084388.1 hypothetical protein [Zhihengliuella flava]